MPTMNTRIVRPILTEKSSVANQERQEYTFEVHPRANKTEIRQAIESLFDVKVRHVWTSQQRGKPRRMGGKAGLRPRWKKAIVKLQDGFKIDGIFEG